MSLVIITFEYVFDSFYSLFGYRYHADGGDGNETNLDPDDNFESFSSKKIKERIKKHAKKKCFFCKGKPSD